MLEAPCKDCAYKGCGLFHSKCEAYQNFKKEYEDLKTKMRNDLENRYGGINRNKPTRISENSPLRGRKYY